MVMSSNSISIAEKGKNVRKQKRCNETNDASAEEGTKRNGISDKGIESLRSNIEALKSYSIRFGIPPRNH